MPRHPTTRRTLQRVVHLLWVEVGGWVGGGTCRGIPVGLRVGCPHVLSHICTIVAFGSTRTASVWGWLSGDRHIISVAPAAAFFQTGGTLPPGFVHTYLYFVLVGFGNRSATYRQGGLHRALLRGRWYRSLSRY